MNRLTLLAAFWLAAVATAQIERPIPYPLTKPQGWDAAVEAGSRTNIGEPGKNYSTNHAHYEIRAELDPETAVVKGHVDAVYWNRSQHSIRSLKIHLRQNLHKEGGVRNRYVEITGGVKVSDVKVDGNPAKTQVRRSLKRGTNATYSTTGTVMTIRLVKPLGAGEKVTVSIDWECKVPKSGAPRNGRDGNHTYYLGYWYPQFAVFDDIKKRFVAEQYMSNAEFYMGYADYDIHFTAPKGWLVRATGELQNPKDVLTRKSMARLAKARKSREIVNVITQSDLDAGKVTRSDKGKKLTWHYRAKNVRDFAVSISDRYLWDATHAVVKNRDGQSKDGIAMIHAVYRADAAGYDRAAEYARHTIEYMSENLYPYPWPHMTVCGGIIGGGMEYPMMTICGASSRRKLGVGLVAHELIHMWFPMIVGSNEKAHSWQDEGFTTFFGGFTVAAFRNKEVDLRRTFRSFKRGAVRGEGTPMMTHGDYYPSEGPGAYGFTSYSKSSIVLHHLREMIGKEVFMKTFRKYVADWAYGHPRPQDFFNAFSAGAGQNLDWFFRTWYFETWGLDQSIRSVTKKENGTEVVVEDLKYATYPTTVKATYANGETETKSIDVLHWLSGKKSKALLFKSDVVEVELNPGRMTLDQSDSNNVWKRVK
ncbi:MAG: hypothetical protein ACI97A_001514 [Planctomycetota bacterium]